MKRWPMVAALVSAFAHDNSGFIKGDYTLPSCASLVDHLDTPLDLSEYLIENKAATFMMRADGDSMNDAGILNGDLLAVDRAAKPVDGSVVVVAVNGEYTVKRLRRCPNCVWLKPASPCTNPFALESVKGCMSSVL